MGKISFWQKIVSYFREIHIESAPSDLNPHLYVSLSKGRFMLSTAKAIYSHGDLYDNFVQTFKRVNWSGLKGRDMLILGYGLGSVPAILEKMGQSFQYTAIEKDASVIYLASKYTLSDLRSPVHLYEADCKPYLQQQTDSFSVICMDVFVEDEIPKTLTTPDFIALLKSHLSSQGVLFVNTIKPKEEQNEPDHLTSFQKRLQKAFPKGTFIETGPNAVFVSNSDILTS
ncbi:MAG: hypothetical protein GVX78_04370 [Bacteroidetes bacterium]|jgi:2-polyprenyl-3-methyl-5-hydroxy-6-metoxy-1,4-benzoquinol methylase|nr:hypothetical protein [Bacteroidota bacterium]